MIGQATSMSQSTVFSRQPTAPLPQENLLRMADAGVRAVDCIRDLHLAGSNLVLEALRGSDFSEWEHYPRHDVYDPTSHAQYYFHAHPPDDRNAPDYGHFHTFMRPKGMPAGVQPAELKKNAVRSADDNSALSHLIAISMTPTGMPVQLFTTNRWVTGETWYQASDVIAMLDRFVIDLDSPSRPLNTWITAMLALFRPQIEQLLHRRDEAVAYWRPALGEADPFEDRALEITSSMDISLIEHIEWIDRRLEPADACPEPTG
jgi:hypothetical protein